MNLSFAQQMQGFLFSLGVGVLLGAFYDVFRILRSMLRPKKSHVFFQDLLYMAVCAIVTFLTSLAYANGEIRFYVLAGELLGWCAWHFTAGLVTVGAFRFLYRQVRRFLIKPIRGVMARLFQQLAKIVKKAGGFLKKFRQKGKKNLKPKRRIVYNHFTIPFSKKRRKKQQEEGSKQ